MRRSLLFSGILFVTLSGVHAGPSIVVTVENPAPDGGTFQTPVWGGFHDGTFDSYDGGSPASALPVSGSDAAERIAEDGNPGPISAGFEAVVADGAQGVIVSNGEIPPLAPGQTSSQLFSVDPTVHRYFSYVSMVIPSNDAFIANGSPTSHPVFDGSGRFVGKGFSVGGDAVNDAGTELNDEVPENTAFLAQAAPNTGVTTEEVITAHPGFLASGMGGILDNPMFANADFLAPGYETLRVRLTKIDLDHFVFLRSRLDAAQETQDTPVDSRGRGLASLVIKPGGESLGILARFRRLSGPVQAAHLHRAPRGQSGAVVVDLGSGIFNSRRGSGWIFARISESDLAGPLEGASFAKLIAELVAAASISTCTPRRILRARYVARSPFDDNDVAIMQPMVD
jgi:hypothetical protein